MAYYCVTKEHTLYCYYIGELWSSDYNLFRTLAESSLRKFKNDRDLETFATRWVITLYKR